MSLAEVCRITVPTTNTIDFYDFNAEKYFAETVTVDMSALHDRFLSRLADGALILDAGCGSGRDSKAFTERGFRVHAFDGSSELAIRASAHANLPVKVCQFEDFAERDTYDGIWACASLLHVREQRLPEILRRLWSALKPAGILFISFKQGDSERVHEGRHFTDATEARINSWISQIPDVATVQCWITPDARSRSNETWLNTIVGRKPAVALKLITGEKKNPFLPLLSSSIAQAAEIDLAVAFIKTTGLRLLMDDLNAALGHDEDIERTPARLRVLTSDYLDVTDPDALRLLMLLKERGAHIRVFEAAGSSFHMKAYLFARFDEERALHGTAFVGSSNISRMALTDGLEWNYRIEYPGDAGFVEARSQFEVIFRDKRTTTLTHAWIEQYESRRVPPPMPVAPGSEEREVPPAPTPVQQKALAALDKTRHEGYRRGLVVLATGLGKTWLAAFDAAQMGARRILFIAHREEILNQAAETFVRIRPRGRVGFYTGLAQDHDVDILCASVQTLGRTQHLERFSPQHFDYVVVDEFHHAAAPTYRRLLAHFTPHFLLGLTATPDRTDQSDILSLCDDNLVFGCGLYEGITAKLLAPFHYYGIWDELVDYSEIPWRNGHFDPEQLTNKLATLARTRHALRQWRSKKQLRTLAFCVSIKHAEYMAEQFRSEGVQAVAVYAGSRMGRSEALEQLSDGRLEIIFSVDLFNEGVDLPAIDTVLMLRPTESKILFLQQLGRGLRKAKGKDKLVVLDFIGNHHSFLHKLQALGNVGATFKELAEFARKIESKSHVLPAGCFINYDLKLIEFLKALDSGTTADDYIALREILGHRPTLVEFYRSGANMARVRQEYGDWFGFVAAMKDLSPEEIAVIGKYAHFLRELETTRLTKSFKMVLLEALQELGGWVKALPISILAEKSWLVIQRRRPLLNDLPRDLDENETGITPKWKNYWLSNPVSAWIGSNRSEPVFFKLQEHLFESTLGVTLENVGPFSALVQELIDFRLAAYEARLPTNTGEVIPIGRTRSQRVELPYFPNLPIACGHFKTGLADAEKHVQLGSGYGRLDPARHFIARASGNSMNGGKMPIRDGDYLLLEIVSPSNAGHITGDVMAIERQDDAGDNQYLLRRVTKTTEGRYILKAANPDYADLEANDEMRTFARFKLIVDPLDLQIGQAFMREDIPPLFGEVFNPGNWNSGQVVLKDKKSHVLLVTLNKQGKAENHRYVDYWIDDTTFHWQSQDSTTPDSARGSAIISHEKLGISLHLFIRENKLAEGKAAPFLYYGKVRYKSHVGSAPMSVSFEIS